MVETSRSDPPRVALGVPERTPNFDWEAIKAAVKIHIGVVCLRRGLGCPLVKKIKFALRAVLGLN